MIVTALIITSLIILIFVRPERRYDIDYENFINSMDDN